MERARRTETKFFFFRDGAAFFVFFLTKGSSITAIVLISWALLTLLLMTRGCVCVHRALPRAKVDVTQNLGHSFPSDASELQLMLN